MERKITENERKYMLEHMEECMFWPDYDDGLFSGVTKALLIMPAFISLLVVGIWFLIGGFKIFGIEMGAGILAFCILIPACMSPFIYMRAHDYYLKKIGFNKQLKAIINGATTIMEVKIKAVVVQVAEAYFDTDEGESLIVYRGSVNSFVPKVDDELFIVCGDKGSLVMKKFKL